METPALYQYHNFGLDSNTTPTTPTTSTTPATSTTPTTSTTPATSVSTSPPQFRKKRTTRKPVHEETDPARAMYLMKNRNAASKCRNKQKKEQVDLVEAARVAELSNKILKAKVAILGEDLKGLMTVVGQHANCADYRLSMYAGRIMQSDGGGLDMKHDGGGLEMEQAEELEEPEEEATMNFYAGIEQKGSVEYGMDVTSFNPYYDQFQPDDNWAPFPQ